MIERNNRIKWKILEVLDEFNDFSVAIYRHVVYVEVRARNEFSHEVTLKRIMPREEWELAKEIGHFYE